MSSIYINKGTKENFVETMGRIQEVVPETEWPYLLLCGDWNIDINVRNDGEANSYEKQKVKRMQAVRTICEQMKLNVKFAEQTRLGSTLDYVLHGTAVVIEDLRILHDNDDSDHNILLFNLVTSCPIRSMKRIRIPDRKLANSFTVNSLRKSQNSLHFLRELEGWMKSRKMDIAEEIKRKPFRNELLQRLMSTIDEDEVLNLIVKEY